jgi:hypothetical protein
MTIRRQGVYPLVGTVFIIEAYVGILGLDPEDGGDGVDIIDEPRDGAHGLDCATGQPGFFPDFPSDRVR